MFFITTMLLLLGCRDDDDMPPFPDLDPDTTLIEVTIPSGIETRVCLDENVLTMLADAAITTTAICRQGDSSTVRIIQIEKECIRLMPGPTISGPSPDTLCVVHCFDTDPEVCDTTYLAITVERSYLNGAYITNEGAGPGFSGSITHYDPLNKALSKNIFNQANARFLGDDVNYIGIVVNTGYILVSGEDKIEVVDLTDFRSLKTITGLSTPRQFCQFTQDRAVVSQWGNNGSSGSLAIIDLSVNDVINSIPMSGRAPEHLLCLDGTILVTYSGAMSTDSTIAFLNTGTMEFDKEIQIGVNPSGIILDDRGQVWTIASGSFHPSDSTQNIPGKLSILGDQQVFESIAVPTGSGNLAYDAISDQLYFTTPTGIMVVDLTNTVLGEIPNPVSFFNTNPYRLFVNPENGNIYVCEQGTGPNLQPDIIVLDQEGDIVDSFKPGVVPGGVFFP